MDKKEAIVFLFTIAQEIKLSFESPVILVTMKDYADCIVNSLVDMRNALLQHAAPERVFEIVNACHFEWLQAVEDVENFKKRIRDIPRDVILRAIAFTKDCAKNRYKYFRQYTTSHLGSMSTQERTLMRADLETIKEMHESLNSVLNDKEKSIFSYADQTEYYLKVVDEIDELLNWLDSLNDNMAIHFSRVVGSKFPQLTSNLSKTLQQITEEIAASSDLDAQKELQNKGQKIGSLACINNPKELEIKQVLEKIQILEKRIELLKNVNSSAVMALQHKALYLEERLMSLENLKASLFTLKNKHNADSLNTLDAPTGAPQIFDHLLPAQERCRLVDQLVKLWKDAICGMHSQHEMHDGKSIISILSVADLKEMFSDELGTFTVDKFGRKVYADSEGNLYQLDETDQLIEIKDDEQHVYFYDNYGRYYVDHKNQRIYKADTTASEYMFKNEDVLLKVKEVEGGIEYNYDCLGRYYLNKNGKHIYCDPGSTEKYEDDGLGNLVLIRRDEPIYESCPDDTTIATEESKYLQQTVGDALKRCIAEVVLHQPADPIKYLSSCLIQYHYNIKNREKLLEEEIKMMEERDLRMREMQGSSTPSYIISGEANSKSSDDVNFLNYKTIAPTDSTRT